MSAVEKIAELEPLCILGVNPTMEYTLLSFL